MNTEAAFELYYWVQGLSHRTSRLLAQHGITSAERLVRLTESDMRQWDGCGDKTIDEISAFAERMEGVLSR